MKIKKIKNLLDDAQYIKELSGILLFIIIELKKYITYFLK